MKNRTSIILTVVLLSITGIVSAFALPWGMKVFSSQEVKKAALPKEYPDPLRDALIKVAQGLSNLQLTGKEYYETYCMVCHGEKGEGDGFNAFNLNPRPTNLAIAQKQGDERLFKAISNGSVSVGRSPLCPPWGTTLRKDRIKSIIAYLHAFGS
jgi:mono/diheme cytochrome c family protein